jgi:hypothetical protein
MTAPQNPQPAPMPFEPGHVMRREHYERMAREAAQQNPT